jgi:hypothetical protein
MPVKTPGRRARLRVAKPLVASFDRVADYQFSEHAIEQMRERNVSPYEALSAIAEPDSLINNRANSEYPETRIADRGDVRVIFDPMRRTIVTVIDLDEELRKFRKLHRVALTPSKAGQIEVRTISDAEAAKTPSQRKPREFEDSEDVRWLLARHSTEDIRYMVVSPVIAEKLLSLNTRNRPKRPRDVNEWADEMAGKRWLTTHQGVALDRNMAIVDGQHRLEAIIESGVSVKMPVAVGLDPEAFKVIDTGRKRTTADALATEGEKSVYNLAAAIRLAYLFDNMLLDGGTRRVHTDVLLAYREGKEEDLREAVRWSNTAPQHGLYLMRTAVAVGYYLLHRDVGNRALVEEFCDGVMYGENLSRDDPCFALRRVAGNDNRRTLTVHFALWLKAWARFATDQPARLLIFKREVEDFPILYMPPKTFRRGQS